MRGLQPPPKTEKPSRLAARFITLLVFAAGAGVAVYAAATNQAADLSEDLRPVTLDLEDPTVIGGFVTNVRVDEGGPDAVVILHDDDITGGLTLSDLSAALGDAYHGVRIDLPGFGYSTRMPLEGAHHTVAGIADRLAPVLEERFGGPVPIVGIGLGGEVGAELALTYPHLVAILVMVDVDFWTPPRFPVSLQSLPWLGKAATYTWETGGRFALENWAPYCPEGGWCPTGDQIAVRSVIIDVERTTDSFHAFRSTRDAALASANLDQITAPTAYVWSTEGHVDDDIVDRLTDEMPALRVFESATFQAHLEDVATVAAALEELAPSS
ncbi:MAG TPA: alpha/beta hydrolase [Acidimicrobiia bacterium]|nr:alpha/beta hydrolase [Acidimicrobiia bacterium]